MPRTVLFLPGIKGSELWEGAKCVWPTFRRKTLQRLLLTPESHRLEAPDVLRQVSRGLKFDVYQPLLSALERSGHQVRVFPYDWRFSVLEHVEDLKRQVRGLAAEAGEPIVLVCHSMGSLLAKSYLLSEENPHLYVQSVITMGAPWRGAPQALRILMYGEMWPSEKYLHYYGAAMIDGSLPGTPDVFADLARSYPTAYELLPTPDYFRDCPFGGYLVRGSSAVPASSHEIAEIVDTQLDFPQNYYTRYAVPFHRVISQPWPHVIPCFSVIGYGHDTVGLIVEEPQYYLERYSTNKTTSKAAVRWVDGDNTVPIISARPPEGHPATVRYVVADHLEITQLPSVHTWVINILDSRPEDYVEGLVVTPEERPVRRDIIMVSCPVEVEVKFEDENTPAALEILSPFPPGVQVYLMGNTRYYSVPSDRNYVIAMESYGTGPLNVSVTRYQGTTPISSCQFREIDLDTRTVAKLEGNREQDPTIKVSRSTRAVDATHTPLVVKDNRILSDRTPPSVNILLEPVDGGQEITGNVWYGPCRLRLVAKDDLGDILEAYYRVNEEAWIRYDGPVVLQEWGNVHIEAFATDLLRNRSRNLSRRSIQLSDPAKHLKLHLEYRSAFMYAFLRTAEGDPPGSDMNIAYSLGDEALRQYSGNPIQIEYNRGEVTLSYQVRQFGHPDYEGREFIIRTDSVQAPVWGRNRELPVELLVDLVSVYPDVVPQVQVDGEEVNEHIDLRRNSTAEIATLLFPEATYQFHLKPTYECYIQQNEIVGLGELVEVEFEMHDQGRQITYPEIFVKLFVKKESRHSATERVFVPEVREDGKYYFAINTATNLPPRERVFRLDFCNYRGVLKQRALLLK